MKAPEWLVGNAPMPRHNCDNNLCGGTEITFRYHDKNNSVYKCCLTCWQAKAVPKKQFAELVTGSFEEFTTTRQEHFDHLQELKKKEQSQWIARLPDDNFYESDFWLKLRYRVLRYHREKFGPYCLLCREHECKERLHVDHIKPRSKYPELALDENNLQVLCRKCNIGKSNLDETDFRGEPA